jgi:D123
MRGLCTTRSASYAAAAGTQEVVRLCVLTFYKWHARGRSHASPAIRFELKPAGEFRCFVRNGRLVGISQRHVADHFPFLADDVPRLQRKMLSFHRDNVQDVFPQPHCECAFARNCVN